ncbi:peptidase M26 [Niallia circulans]|uniref:GLUG motif-containing protein n=1 Tax=Niallia circulans TaxID=1397 RepID=UPI00148FE433|nr:GLUG motif-containing protein [Niallia circulans]QJX61015.1 peptidase M26 [Niallia circulans]
MLGAGTQSNPYIISTPQDLNAIRNNLTAYYELANDIDMSSFGNFASIGKSSPYFRGFLDGKGYKIKNITVNETIGCVGLFGYISNDSSYIRNLGLENCNISGGDVANWCGAISGALNHGTIENCYATGTVQGKYMVGGLVGQFPYGTIKNCYANVNVTGFGRVGGLLGYSTNVNCIVENCHSTGIATHTEIGTAYPAGGLIGNAIAITVTNSYWDMNSSGLTNSQGGTGKTTAEMKTQSTYIGWDFTSTWGFNNDYPYLQVFGLPVAPPKVVVVETTSNILPIISTINTNKKVYKVTESILSRVNAYLSKEKRTERNVSTYSLPLHTSVLKSNRTVRNSTQNVNAYILPIHSDVYRTSKKIEELLSYIKSIQAHTDVLYPLNTNVYNAYLNVLENRSMASYTFNVSQINTIENPSIVEVIE